VREHQRENMETQKETDGRRRKRKEEVKHRWREMRKEKEGNGEMKGLFFTVCFGLYLLHFNPCYHSHTNTHLLPPSLSLVYFSLSLLLAFFVSL